MQLGAFACVLAALPYETFELERHLVPKELALYLTAFGATLFALAPAARLAPGARDLLLVGFLGWSAASTALAANLWLALPAFGVSLAGALLFWTARQVTRAGFGRALRTALAAAVVLAAATALLQAYGVESSLFAERRSPGGTFGNRNFMAHLVAIGLPLVLLVATEARGRGRWLGAVAVMLLAAALVLSRTRAAWLAVGVTVAILAVETLGVARLHRVDPPWRKRARGLALAALAGVAAALLLPNDLDWRSDSPYLESLVGVANYREGSGRGRLIQYGNTLGMVRADPILGVGPGNWAVAYPRFTTPGDPAFDPDDVIPTNPWPSSDWVALLAERGAIATLLLLAFGGSLTLAAWRRWRDGPRKTESLGDLALGATSLATLLVGAFDAVLLLPAPTLFAWTIAGSLAADLPDPPVRTIPLDAERRRLLRRGLTLTGACLATYAALRWGAMAVFTSAGSVRVAARATWLDPGSYRMRMLLARNHLARGDCRQARVHAEAASGLFPNHPAPKQILRRCRRPG
ncbi:MAG TPA: O-antigen ligase family protein [Gemmatimonadales bacterium]|nr:O-antigen ligase family protein [Gemmatimonadales bacterium]